MIFDTISKRKHVLDYDLDIVPDKELIEDLLRQTHHVTPSKQNIMPYHVNVFGPNEQDAKNIIYDKVVGNHIRMEEDGVKHGETTKASNKVNPFYIHVKHNPYLIVFSQRVVPLEEVNPYYKAQHKRGHFMDQCSPRWVERIRSSVAIEVGLFTQNLAALVLEQGLDYSTNVCFPGNIENWSEFSCIEQGVLLMMSIGKAKKYRRDYLEEQGKNHLDFKTSFENVVRFINYQDSKNK